MSSSKKFFPLFDLPKRRKTYEEVSSKGNETNLEIPVIEAETLSENVGLFE